MATSSILLFVAGIFLLVFIIRFLAHSLRLVLIVLLMILAAVYFFDISISQVLTMVKKLVLTYI